MSYLATDATGVGEQSAALFSGGGLLHGSVGRTDLVDPALTTALTRAQWLTARRLAALPADTTLHPTHGFGSFCSSHLGCRRTPPATVGRRAQDQPGPDHLARPLRLPAARRARTGAERYYAHMATRTPPAGPRRIPRAGLRLDDAESGRGTAARGQRWSTYAAPHGLRRGPHPPGAITVPAGPQLRRCTLGWVIALGQPAQLVVSDSEAVARVGAARAGLHRHRGREQRDHRSRTADHGMDRSAAYATAAGFATEAHGHRRRSSCSTYAVATSGGPATCPEPSTSPCTSWPDASTTCPPGEVWVHCAGGYRATVAAGLLDRAGRDVVLIDDDFAHVRELGIPLLRGRSAA